MSATKPFTPEFTTRSGKRVSFGAGYTHDTQAKRRAGLTKAGRAPVATAPAAPAPRRFRARPWLVFVVSSCAMGAAAAVHFLGPVAGTVMAAFVAYFAYRTARWIAGEVAYFAVKGRQIRGREQVATAAADGSEARVVGDTVNAPARRW